MARTAVVCALATGCQWPWPGLLAETGSARPDGDQGGSAASNPEPRRAFEYYRIVREGSMDPREAMSGRAGDTLELAVIQTFPDGVTLPLPASASVSWGGPPVLTARYTLDKTPLATGSTLASLATGLAPGPAAARLDEVLRATWVRNPDRTDHQLDLEGLLFLLDPAPGATTSVEVTCRITGPFPAATASAFVTIEPGPAGDSGSGKHLFEALCASCHGNLGKGSPPTPDHRAYEMGHNRWLYPAPSLVGKSTPGSGALLALMVMGDLGQNGRSLRSPMPNWRGIPNPDTGKLMGAAEFADLVAHLRTLP